MEHLWLSTSSVHQCVQDTSDCIRQDTVMVDSVLEWSSMVAQTVSH